MKALVLDTHALVWFLQKDLRLPLSAQKAILDKANLKFVPFIAICEIHYLHARGRFPLSSLELQNHLDSVSDFEVISHGMELLPHLLCELEIHDALIVASAYMLRDSREMNVKIVSKDRTIAQHSKVPVIWS